MNTSFVSCILFTLLGFIIVRSEFEGTHVQSSWILSTGNFEYSLNLYKELLRDKNLFFSPFSVRVALAMTAAGAGGRTRTQIIRALQLHFIQNELETNSDFQSYLNSFCPNANFTLTTANRMYLGKNYPIKKSFIETVQKYFLSSAENVDFARDAAGVAQRVNRWVEERTNGTIKDLITPDVFTADTVLFLVNAVYFKGKWSEPFPQHLTNPGPFHLADGRTVQVPMMFVRSWFLHAVYPPLKSQILRLNYMGERLAMYIILPQKGIALSAVQKNLTSAIMKDFIHYRPITLSGIEVEVSLPKFRIRYTRELTPALRSLGMTEVFGDSADLSRMSSGPVHISTVLHRAFVAVDEEGTVAAAVTGAMGVAISAAPPAISFKVDRPCIYFIYDRKFHQILFMGNLDDPSLS